MQRLFAFILFCVIGVSSVFTVAAPSTVAAGPRLVTQNVHFYRDSIGGLWALGEVVNRGSAPAASIAVEVGVYNQQGQRLARGITLESSVNVLQPGHKAVWTTTMTDNPKHWARVVTKAVQTISASDLMAHNYTHFKLSAIKLVADNPGYSQKVTGRLTNTGTKTAHIDAITVALYAPGGRLVYVNDQGLLYPWSSKQNLRPGQTAPFSIDVLGYTKRPARMKVYVRAEDLHAL